MGIVTYTITIREIKMIQTRIVSMTYTISINEILNIIK